MGKSTISVVHIRHCCCYDKELLKEQRKIVTGQCVVSGPTPRNLTIILTMTAHIWLTFKWRTNYFDIPFRFYALIICDRLYMNLLTVTPVAFYILAYLNKAMQCSWTYLFYCGRVQAYRIRLVHMMSLVQCSVFQSVIISISFRCVSSLFKCWIKTSTDLSWGCGNHNMVAPTELYTVLPA